MLIHPQIHTLTVCYPVVFYRYNDYQRLMQSIQYNLLMGADHFLIYVMRAGPEVTSLLQYYRAKGHMTILHMPDFPASRSWYFGQSVAIHDCHYRSRYSSRHIAMQDHDEYILPLQHPSWLHMLEAVEKNATQHDPDIAGKDVDVASFGFLHAFYCGNPMNATEEEMFKSRLGATEAEYSFIQEQQVALFVEQHRLKHRKYPKRAKTIYRPQFVRYPGIHFPKELYYNSVTIVVNTSVAFLAHHRRTVEPGFFDLIVLPFYKEYLDVLASSLSSFEKYAKEI